MDRSEIRLAGKSIARTGQAKAGVTIAYNLGDAAHKPVTAAAQNAQRAKRLAQAAGAP
jgi:hypothetical protein